ncbi:MAG: tRNA-dihydrouridine synthase [Erysipelothrix sp.]|nr:tRNA-dihydrouridine synthase [Erysipelothrix sp.]
MSNNFWKDLEKPFYILAPMEDVTDIVFRHVIAEAAAPDVYFTEFTNAASYSHAVGKEALRGRLLKSDDEHPIVAHIWGDEVSDFENISHGVKEMGYAGIDINMGCPAPNVFKHGRGAGLTLRFDVAADLISAAKVSGLPVSVKTRLGHAKVSEYKEWISHLLKQDIANLSVHLRTKVEMSKADPHYELIPDILALRDELAPDTLITINGDILTYTDGQKMVEEFGVDGIMIGRGVFRNPFAFEKIEKEHSHIELINLLKRHLDLYDHYTSIEPSLSKPLHRFFKIYIKEFKGAFDLRVELMQTKTTDDVRAVLAKFEASDYYKELKNA